MFPDDKNELVPLEAAARRLRVKSGWLRDEATAGRVPSLQAGTTFLFHYPTLRKALIERAKGSGKRKGVPT